MLVMSWELSVWLNEVVVLGPKYMISPLLPNISLFLQRDNLLKYFSLCNIKNQMLVVPQSLSLTLTVMMFYREASSPTLYLKSQPWYHLLQKVSPKCPGWAVSLFWVSILSCVYLSPGNYIITLKLLIFAFSPKATYKYKFSYLFLSPVLGRVNWRCLKDDSKW